METNNKQLLSLLRFEVAKTEINKEYSSLLGYSRVDKGRNYPHTINHIHPTSSRKNIHVPEKLQPKNERNRSRNASGTEEKVCVGRSAFEELRIRRATPREIALNLLNSEPPKKKDTSPRSEQARRDSGGDTKHRNRAMRTHTGKHR